MIKSYSLFVRSREYLSIAYHISHGSVRCKSQLSAIKSGLRKTDSFAGKPRRTGLKETWSPPDRNNVRPQRSTGDGKRAYKDSSSEERPKWSKPRKDKEEWPPKERSSVGPRQQWKKSIQASKVEALGEERLKRRSTTSNDRSSPPNRRERRAEIFKKDKDNRSPDALVSSGTQSRRERPTRSKYTDTRQGDLTGGQRQRLPERQREGKDFVPRPEPRAEPSRYQDRKERNETDRRSDPDRPEDTSKELEIGLGFRTSLAGTKVPERTPDTGTDVLTSIPYTTAGSIFLYGTHSVLAALRARRRKVYKLYILRDMVDDDKGKEIETLARRHSIPVQTVDHTFMPVVRKIVQDRPHNGFILEASPLPFPPVAYLGKPNGLADTVSLFLDPQSAEDREINAASTYPLSTRPQPWRHPLVVLVDGILDPGNLGNILRTCHFYAVDAVAICVNTCAPVTSPVVVKASSGAAEALRLFAINKPSSFVRQSSINGWTACAAVAPYNDYHASYKAPPQLKTSNMRSPAVDAPTVLMIGSEGEGLRKTLRDKSKYDVSIEAGAGRLDVGVDSLNVGAATAVLVEAFMRKPTEDGGKVKASPPLLERIL